MRRIAWLGVVAALTSIAVGCSDDDDDLVFGDPGGAAGASGSAGALSASGGTATGGAVSPGSGGFPVFGGAASGGTQSGGTQSGGKQSGGSSTAGAPAGGISAGGNSAGAGGTGGRVSTGGRGSTGGRSSGGRSSTGGRSAGTGGSVPATPAECSVTLDGATGDEPGGLIPVCCTPAAAEKTLIEEVFMLLNEHRMANGESALAYDTELESAIQGHCVHMSQHSFFAHEAEEEGVVTPWDRAELCGTSANGENIAQGQRSAADVMEDWTNSSGHNQNMLSSNFTRVGIGYTADGRSWGQLFGQ
jgi:uncharacterized protein YkwD